MKLPKPLRFLRNMILFFFISTILTVVVYRFVPVYITPLMVIRSVQQVFKGESPRWHHTWVSPDKISPHLPMAVIASEDNRFATHNGFDFIEIQPQSSWVRKGLEVYFTVLIEFFWSKERIMEVYLNSIEMGKGIYGAQAAAQYKFKTTAAKLSAGQCALIAATLPNPIRFDSAHPSPYIKKRQGQILRLMKLVPKFQLNEKRTKE